MFIVTNGTLAVLLCIVTMLCWKLGQYPKACRKDLAL